MFFGATPQDVVGVNLASEYIALDPLVYNGQQVYRDFTGDLYRGTFAISSTCAEPEKLLQWVDYLYTDEGFLAAQVGREGEDYDWNDDGTWRMPARRKKLSPCRARIPFGQPRCPPMPVRKFK